MTRAFHMNEAMAWSKGALNCFLAAKINGQGYIGGYVGGSIRRVRQHLEAARALPRPSLP